MKDKPSIDELLDTAKKRMSMLSECCGFRAAQQCHHCIASQKIVDAAAKYEAAKVNDWPDEIPACEKCGSFSEIGRFGMGDLENDDGPSFDLCADCYADTDGFREWLCDQIKETLDADENYELQPDGKTYKFIGPERKEKQL